MSEFRVPVVRVRAIEPIPGADNIELAVVGEYRSVIQKGQYLPGDLAIYLPESALLPAEIVEKLGLVGKLAGPEHNRVKAIKLRGCVSQGILLCPDLPDFLFEGQDLAESLNVIKWEPPIPSHMDGEVAALFGHTLHYDIENFKAYPDILEPGEVVQYTEKVHGTFVAVTRVPGLNHPEMINTDTLVYSKGLGQKGLVFKDNEANRDNLYLRTIKELDIPNRLKHETQPITILGEIYGNGVQDLHYDTKKPQFMMFDMYVGKPDQGYFCNRFELDNAARRMGIPRVPVLYLGPFDREILTQYTNGQTVAGNGSHIREGIVITPMVERQHPLLGRVILKSVSSDYLFRKHATEFA